MIEFLELTFALGAFLAPLAVVATLVVFIVEGHFKRLVDRLCAAIPLMQRTQPPTRKGRSARLPVREITGPKKVHEQRTISNRTRC